jgi:hypothetical protein
LQGGPRKEIGFRNVAPGRPAGAVEQNPASAPALAAGEGRGKGLGLLGARFGVLDRAVAAPASKHAGGGRCCNNPGN